MYIRKLFRIIDHMGEWFPHKKIFGGTPTANRTSAYLDEPKA